MSIELIILVSLAMVAFLYAAVGHGGASGYIAVFTLCGIAMPVYRPLVLLMNVLVAGSSFLQYSMRGYFRWNLLWPFLLTSVPAAFLGARLQVPQHLYKLIMGLALIYPVLRLSGIITIKQGKQLPFSLPAALCIGAVIGFASGMLNIGGGIFLSPVLLLLGWANMKEAAAMSAAFILCNSVAGLMAMHWDEYMFPGWWGWWLSAAVAGGLLGGWIGSRNLSALFIQRLLALVLAMAAFKLIFLS